MKRLLPASAALTLAAGSLAAAPAPPDGKALYDANCSACHMVAGEGVPGQQPPLRLSRFAAGPPEALIRLLLEGSASRTDKRQSWPNEMPTFEDLPDDEIAATLTYVRASFGNKARPVAPAQVKAVREKKK
jgi:mono/diheme cytochrome c family protein